MCLKLFPPDQCAQRVNLPFEDLVYCYNSLNGDIYQLNAEIATNAVQNPLAWVPTTAVDGVFDAEISRRAEYYLDEVICELIDYRASICMEKRDRVWCSNRMH